MPVVVAHLDRIGEPARVVATRARSALAAGHRIAIDVPGRPIEPGHERSAPVAGTEAEQRRIIHLRRGDDLARVHAVVRIEQRLDLGECVVDPRSELPRDPFAAAQPVTVLAGIGAFVFPHHRGGFLGDRAHLRRAVAAHVEDRPHVQRAHRGVRVPGAARAVAREDLGERVGVAGEMRERHRAILDEADRFAITLQAHHDVEPSLAHLPEILLQRVVDHLDNTGIIVLEHYDADRYSCSAWNLAEHLSD